MMSITDSVLSQYEKTKQATSGNRVSQEDRMKKYFNTVVPKGSRSCEKRIRILPTKDGSTPFVEVKFHEFQVDGKWVKLYDPAQEGKRSPLNEVYDALMSTGMESDKELARSYRSRKYYIVKVIDRENEQDGVKFWRFKFNSKNDGILDKIFPIFRNKGDITDIFKGRDLIVTVGLTKSGKGQEYSSVQSILPEDPSPLHEDSNVAKQWIEDPLVWSDVYSKKSEEYLDMVAKGETPRWDSATNKYVSNSTSEETLSSNKKPATVVDPQSEDEEDSELPF